jgi:hypothetical protein
MAEKGTVFAVGGLGVLLVWSGVSNKGFLTSVRDVVQGVQPTAGPAQSFLSQTASTTATAPSTGTGSSGSPNNAPGGQQSDVQKAANKVLGQQMAAAYGWGSGPEWTAFNDVVMEESGWDAEVANDTSDARGIAQNINGWSSSYQEGNAAQQIAWMLSYIKQRYGDPIAAQQFHLDNNWY